jgi:geranylgeranyl diphosphate synthase type II
MNLMTTSSFDLKNYLSSSRALVDEALSEYLPSEKSDPAILHKAMRYSVFCGGKRLRPILALTAADVCGGDIRDAMPAACALEMIHTFSLIHDDLPALDNDDLRRGRPTCHKVFGEAMAILAGDALFAMGYETITRHTANIGPEALANVLKTISIAVGSHGMVGGQVADLENEGNSNLDIQTIQSIHARKTGALLKASLLSGAIVASATPAQHAALEIYGEKIGLAFQIADDLLDILGDEQILGKPIGSDEKNQKATYPKLLGIDGAKEAARRATDEALSALEIFGRKAEPLKALAEYMIDRKS